ncbi:thiopurine S-methyltransferase [Legionella brunensis]|uniref:Thiopurine S-methyltransferase n=1 Tax=Legionella brunensis TaxID=29422 RepID=A0A0W0S1A2_9GAMM|nr:thiopurine S-methyltransferase [Legionella brunensis]KTC76948.1 thiopurine S-methyltransferase [Legionella brunensis]
MNSGKQFWLNIWQEGSIPFHQEAVNQDLVKYWPSLGMPLGATVLVPLCGKSLDLLWLAKQGFQVIGIELSELAVQEFAKENKLLMTKEVNAQIISYVADSITIWVTDIFHLNSACINAVDAIYDRAALIALPEKLRSRYVKTCLQWLKKNGKILLKTMSYDQGQMQGPPFSVPGDEVNALYSNCQRVKCIKEESRNVTSSDHLNARGLQSATDNIWLIEY